MTSLSYLEAVAYVEKVAYEIRALLFDLNAVHTMVVNPKTLRGPLVNDLELRYQIELRRLSAVIDDLRTYCVPRLKEAQTQADEQAKARAQAEAQTWHAQVGRAMSTFRFP